MLDHKQLWDSVLMEMELGVSKANFNTWLKDTHITRQDEGAVYLSVPNMFAKEWLLNKYHSVILKHVRTLAPHIHSIEYIVSKDDGRPKDREKSVGDGFSMANRELPLNDYYINKDDNLNPRYTFETFVIGPYNELAHAAAQAIVKKPVAYNPLFIHGNTGHGKTHLIQAVGNHIKHTNRDKKVMYVTAERFSNDIVTGIQTGKITQVKEKYRKYDVLIMDDIQFVSNKDKSQEELFHVFNSLYDNNKQIIFSSDKHPNLMNGIEDRLRSRFGMGMTVDIPAPDFESRIAILKAKAKSYHNMELTAEVVEHIAESVAGNIRELEGVLNSIVCQMQLKNRELSLNEIRVFLRANNRPKKSVSIKEIVKMVADYYRIEEESIYEKTRKKEVIKPRQVAMYILREDFSISYPSIGQKLGGRDHTTVIHSCEKIKNDLKSDATLTREINDLRSMIT